MEQFDEIWDDGAANADLELNSDPEELWRSLIPDEEYPRYWSESAWSHDPEVGSESGALLFADGAAETELAAELRLSELWARCDSGCLAMDEFFELSALITRVQFLEAAQRIKAMGAEAVLLSLGGRGVVAVNENQLLEVIPPRTDAVSPLGAGDALAAAYVWAATKKKDFAECVRWAVAAGTASAMQPGLVFANLEQTKEVYKSVEVRRA